MHSPILGADEGDRNIRPKMRIQGEFVLNVFQTKTRKEYHSKLYLNKTVSVEHKTWNKA